MAGVSKSLFALALLSICFCCVISAEDDSRPPPRHGSPPPLPPRFSTFDDAKKALPKDFSRYSPVNVTIFLESLCPDSRRYIMQQVYPTVFQRTIPAELYTIDFVLYGNAETIYDSATKKYSFHCQHGAEECSGNIYEICYDYVVRNSTRTLAYLNCVFEETDHDIPIRTAATDCAASLTDVHSLHDAWAVCSDSMGPPLHAYAGERTNALRPRHNFIPWTTFDTEGSSNINDEAIYRFSDLVLKYWYKKNSPAF